MRFHVVIPSRYASTRLPGKPMLDIGGRPMVQCVVEQACRSGAERVVVATDDARIAAAVHDPRDRNAAIAMMTDPELPSGTDRVAAVAAALGWDEGTVVVNVQGDEPFMPPALIEQAAATAARRCVSGNRHAWPLPYGRSRNSATRTWSSSSRRMMAPHSISAARRFHTLATASLGAAGAEQQFAGRSTARRHLRLSSRRAAPDHAPAAVQPRAGRKARAVAGASTRDAHPGRNLPGVARTRRRYGK